jgi:hypothetical protein
MVFDSACDNSAQIAKSGASLLVSADIYNSTGANIFIQLFDTSGAPTVGTTVPNYVLFVPAMGGYVKDTAIPYKFVNNIYYSCTTTPTGAVAPAVALTASFGVK